MPSHTAFIGFCGAPWTVASYMIAGTGHAGSGARQAVRLSPSCSVSIAHRQVGRRVDRLSERTDPRRGRSRADFRTPGLACLPTSEFQRWCARTLARIIAGVRQHHPHARIIAFPRGATTRLPSFVQQTGALALGLDTAVDPGWAARTIPETVVLQGHLDPLALFAGGRAQEDAVSDHSRRLPGPQAHLQSRARNFAGNAHRTRDRSGPPGSFVRGLTCISGSKPFMSFPSFHGWRGCSIFRDFSSIIRAPNGFRPVGNV